MGLGEGICFNIPPVEMKRQLELNHGENEVIELKRARLDEEGLLPTSSPLPPTADPRPSSSEPAPPNNFPFAALLPELRYKVIVEHCDDATKHAVSRTCTAFRIRAFSPPRSQVLRSIAEHGYTDLYIELRGDSEEKESDLSILIALVHRHRDLVAAMEKVGYEEVRRSSILILLLRAFLVGKPIGGLGQYQRYPFGLIPSINVGEEVRDVADIYSASRLTLYGNYTVGDMVDIWGPGWRKRSNVVPLTLVALLLRDDAYETIPSLFPSALRWWIMSVSYASNHVLFTGILDGCLTFPELLRSSALLSNSPLRWVAPRYFATFSAGMTSIPY